MEVLKDAGTYEILTPVEELKAQLLRIERAGRTCYQSFTGDITHESAVKFVRMLLKRGHESVIEHSNLTVRFMNCSRGLTHELVRHRLCAFSQESTRYVDYDKRGDGDPDLDRFHVKFVVPPHRDERETIPLAFSGPDDKLRKRLAFTALSPLDMAQLYELFYRSLRKKGWKPEDARQFLPIGTKSEIVISANLREWRHIFFMRTSKYAHWEIRRVMCNLLEELQGLIPVIFEDFVEAGVDKNGLRYFEKKAR